MRHDTHYVEKLTSKAFTRPVRLIDIKKIKVTGSVEDTVEQAALTRSIRQYGVLQPLLLRVRQGRYELVAGAKRLRAAAAAGLTEVPCLMHEADDARARNLAEATNLSDARGQARFEGGGETSRLDLPAVHELERYLQTMTSCLQMVTDPNRPLRDRVMMELMRAEVQGMTRLIQGLRVLSEVHQLTLATIEAREIVERVLAMLEPERRLLDIQITLDFKEGPTSFSADERLLSVALAGAVGSMMAFFRNFERGKLDVSWNASASRGRFVVSQDMVTLPITSFSRIFDQNWPDHPAGYSGAVGLIAARRVADLHGGSLHVGSQKQGSRINLELPLAQ
jgi:signal transduction histidine kinase